MSGEAIVSRPPVNLLSLAEIPQALSDEAFAKPAQSPVSLLSLAKIPQALSDKTFTKPAQPPKSYLDKGIDSVSSLFVKDEKTRDNICYFSGEFLKTAALFARRRVGLAGVVLAYGLDQASPDSKPVEQVVDFGLGTTKGLVLKGIFIGVAQNLKFAPSKGVLMGIGSRSANTVLERNNLANPSAMVSALKADIVNPQMWLFDGATFMAGEGLFGIANKVTAGAIAKNNLASSMVMGGSFGYVNGGSAELIRQQEAGEGLQIGKIIKHGTVEGLVGALGAGAGVTASEPRAIFSSHPARIENSLIKSDVRAQAPKLVEKPSLAILEVAGRPMKAVGIDVFPNVGQSKITLNAMAPLLVGVDPANPLGSSSRPHWQAFERDLVAAKKLGIEGISTDVWWGMIEPRPGKFDWRYYDHLSTTIQKHGLKWVPILSLHQAGGNVGDNVNIPIPLWVWNKAGSRVPSRNPDAVKFVSEQGNKSHEYVSYWGTPYIIDRKANVMKEFQSHFAGKAHSISELNISLGTAGEIRYPSYNSHDQGSGYPTRGALQAYSELAKASFRNYSIKKYGSVEAVKEAWGPEFKDGIGPPREPQSFFDQGKHLNTRYGRDFFDWYSDSLLNHGRLMLGTAVDVFGAKGAPFAGIDIGAKMPGVHWRVGSKEGDQIVLGDRLAELSAGLIRTSRGDYGSDAMGRGYRPLMQMFAEVQAKSPYSRIVPHFTALEMMDGHEGPTIKAMPHTLSRWVGQEAVRNGLTIKAENALNWTLYDQSSWSRMRSVLAFPGNKEGYYSGLTFLRLSDVVNNDVPRNQLIDLVRTVEGFQQRPESAVGQ